MKRISTQSGFSLVEMLVYIAILILITSVAVTSLLSFNSSFQRYTAKKMLNQQAQVILDRMRLDLRNAMVVDAVASTFGSSPGTLEVMRGTSTQAYTLNSGAVILTENGTVVGALNTSPVTVTNLTFTHYSNTETELVRVALTVAVNANGVSESETYRTSMVLRGSYE